MEKLSEIYDSFINLVVEIYEYIIKQLGLIGIVDVLDILLVALIFYYTFRFVRERRAGKLLMGILFLLFLLFLSDALQMRALNFILTNLFSVGIIAIIILFQPELRSALEKMGGESLKGFRGKLDKDEEAALRNSISEICVAAESLSNSRTGALIVFERSTKLGDYIRTGTIVDAQTSSFLITNIFFNKAPLHDGAVIIRDSRIHSAGCFLPLSTNNEIIKELGTRHRAGIGMSENSDAIVLIISEESGIISVAIDGVLKRGYTRKTLEDMLDNLLLNTEKNQITSRVKGKIFKRKRNGKTD
ncbi:MAG: diadenylate cyclase CdaA [Eubacteriales bacterium]|nr:diadenylate cyclase CdaA [Eubacteriales bacterium]MDD4422988.1 diadenylate cyclase CdaA [Eubacteriales bacterium]HBR32890.1 TIGR00159 family protein [Clostridiales bacterium]